MKAMRVILLWYDSCFSIRWLFSKHAIKYVKETEMFVGTLFKNVISVNINKMKLRISLNVVSSFVKKLQKKICQLKHTCFKILSAFNWFWGSFNCSLISAMQVLVLLMKHIRLLISSSEILNLKALYWMMRDCRVKERLFIFQKYVFYENGYQTLSKQRKIPVLRYTKLNCQ